MRIGDSDFRETALTLFPIIYGGNHRGRIGWESSDLEIERHFGMFRIDAGDAGGAGPTQAGIFEPGLGP